MAYLNVKEGRLQGKNGQGRKLTPKMRSFINAYCGPANYNALEAIRLSDYECKTAYSIHMTSAELMLHPLVLAEIEKRMIKKQEKSEIKAEYLLQKLIEIIDDGEVEKTADRLRAIELAGKAIALWKERQEVTGADGEAIRIEQERKETVAEFTSRISRLANRDTADGTTVVPFRSGTSGT